MTFSKSTTLNKPLINKLSHYYRSHVHQYAVIGKGFQKNMKKKVFAYSIYELSKYLLKSESV